MARTEKSRKKTKFLFILIVLTAILSILSTYAWFSTQRDVAITGLNVNVNVAESMQISLDGETWTQTIEITDMKQLLGTSTESGVHQAANGDNNNYVPSDLQPVSTVGSIGTTGKIPFRKGVLEGLKLTNISTCNEEGASNTDHPYLYFDLYVRNVSSKAEGEYDTIQLNAGSKVTAEQDGVGLAESVRVGFLSYNTNTANLTAETGTDVRTATKDGGESDRLAIWEPNYNKHTQAVVRSDKRITAVDTVYSTKGIKDSLVDGSEIPDVQDDTDTTSFAAVTTNQIEQNTDKTTKEAATLNGVVADKDLAVEANKITKIRIYIWLEGQDPDCVDVASTGKMINADIKLIKPTTTTTEP